MAPRHPGRQRIEIDVPFATMPQALILDMRVSHAAMRLWGVLFVLRWTGEPPDFPRLAEAMDGATERSVYRWLIELESAGWIDWNRHADLQERFTLRTEKHGAKLTYRSNSASSDDGNLIVGSNLLTPGSINLIQRSIFEGADGVATPQSDATHKNQKIQNDDDDEARAIDIPTEQALVKRDFSVKGAREVAGMGLDLPTLIAFIDAMLAAGKSHGHILNRLRRAPPKPGERYGSQRVSGSGSPGDGANRPRRGNGRQGGERPGGHDRAPKPGELAYYEQFLAGGAPGAADGE